MRLRLEADQDELLAKGDRLLEELAQALYDVHPDLADRLHKAAPEPEPQKLPYRALRDLQEKFASAYVAQLAAMNKDIFKVLDQASREVRKSVDDE